MKSRYWKSAVMTVLVCVLASPVLILAQSRETIRSEREAARIAYERRISETPRPTNSEEHNRICRDLRVEAARQRSVGEGSRDMFSGQRAIEFEIAWQRNVALVEAKAVEFNCSAAFSDQQSTEKATKISPIQQCIAACIEHTKRTSEQCFDSCNK
jgi:hypothetical protein